MEKIANKIIDINQPLQILIQDVTIQNPKKYNVDYWKLPMYEIVTEHGNYIASGLFGDRFHWNEFVGQTLSVWSQESESPQWLWLRIKKNPITISFDKYIEGLYSLPKDRSYYVYKIQFARKSAYSYVGFTSQNPPQERYEQHLQQIHDNKKNKNFHYYLNNCVYYNIKPNFEIIGEYKNEITALFSEIINISKDRKQNHINLNNTFGGEGNEFKVNSDDNNQLTIEDRFSKFFIH